MRKTAKLTELLPDKVRQDKSCAIMKFALTVNELKEARNVLLFLSTPTEPDTSDLIEKLNSLGKNIYVPVVDGDEFYVTRYAPGDELTTGRFGIREPYRKVPAGVVPEVAVVPMVAFDGDLTRLGHGKGYYDRYLAGKSVYKLGVCFAARKFGHIPHNEFDVPMDVIVTEEGILSKDESNSR